MFCQKCGNQFNDDSKFCPYCGSPVYAGEEKGGQVKRKNSKLIIGTAAGAAAAFLIVGWAVLSGGNHNMPPQGGSQEMGAPESSDTPEAQGVEAYYRDITEDDVMFENDILYADSQILLTAGDGVSKEQIEELAGAQGGDIVGYVSISNDYQIVFADGKTYDELEDIIDEWEQDERIENAALNYVSYISPGAVDYRKDPWINADDAGNESGSGWTEAAPSGNNWWAEAVMMPSVWEMDAQFQPVKVGIYDSMFDTDNEDLADRFVKIWNNPEDENGNCGVTSLYSNAADEETTLYSHGSHVAGLVAAEAENGFGIAGVSQNAQLYGFAFASDATDTEDVSRWGDIFEIKYCIAEMLNEGVKVINLSVGFGEQLVAAQHGVESAVEELERYSSSMEDFLAKCIGAGYDFLIVKSAGNESGYAWTTCSVDEEHPFGYAITDGEADTVYDVRYDFMGAIEDESVREHILIVGAAENRMNYYKTAFFSNVGDRIDVYAPGTEILSDLPTNITAMMDGTSMSAPIVTGIAALVWGVNPDLSAEQVADMIRASISVTLFDSESVSNLFYTVDTTPIANAYFAVQLALGAAGEGSETGGSGIITGMTYIIDDSEKASVLENVSVTVTDKDGNTAGSAVTSEASGFSFVLPAGTYSVTAEADGYETVNKELSISENEVQNINIVMEKAVIELTDYYDDLSGYIEAAGLQAEDDVTYTSDLIQAYFLYSDMKEFTVYNADPQFSAYGVRPGDSKEDAMASIAGYGLAVSDSLIDGKQDIYLWDDNSLHEIVCISLFFGDDGNVRSWSACNWPQGEVPSYYMDILKKGHEKGLTEFEDWQAAYFEFIINDHLEHYNSNMCDYTLVYINDDNIPELYVEYGSTADGSLIAYFNGSEVVTQYMYTMGLSYLERENLFCDTGGHMDEYYDNVYTIGDGGFEIVVSGNFGAENNADIQYDENGQPVYEYYWNGEKTTQSGYEENLNEAFDKDRAVSPFGEYDSSTGMYEGFYSCWDIPSVIMDS